MFDTLSDRLATTFKNLRGKGRLSPQDIDDTLRAIRQALLEADVSRQAVRLVEMTAPSPEQVRELRRDDLPDQPSPDRPPGDTGMYL